MGIIVLVKRDMKVQQKRICDMSNFKHNLDNSLNGLEKLEVTPTDLIDKITLYRKGNIISIYMNKTTRAIGDSVGTTITIYENLPQKFRPLATAQQIVPVTTSLEIKTMYMLVKSSGLIKVRFTSDIPNGSSLYARMVYIGANY